MEMMIRANKTNEQFLGTLKTPPREAENRQPFGRTIRIEASPRTGTALLTWGGVEAEQRELGRVHVSGVCWARPFHMGPANTGGVGDASRGRDLATPGWSRGCIPKQTGTFPWP